MHDLSMCLYLYIYIYQCTCRFGIVVNCMNKYLEENSIVWFWKICKDWKLSAHPKKKKWVIVCQKIRFWNQWGRNWFYIWDRFVFKDFSAEENCVPVVVCLLNVILTLARLRWSVFRRASSVSILRPHISFQCLQEYQWRNFEYHSWLLSVLDIESESLNSPVSL